MSMANFLRLHPHSYLNYFRKFQNDSRRDTSLLQDSTFRQSEILNHGVGVSRSPLIMFINMSAEDTCVECTDRNYFISE